MAEMMGIDESHHEIDKLWWNRTSVLFLSPRWQCDGCGIANINRQLITDIRKIDPEGKAISIKCAVVEEEGKISQKDQDDSRKHNVSLVGAKPPRQRRKRPAELSWLDEYPHSYYRHILQKDGPSFVVGHIPYLAFGAFNISEMCQEQMTFTAFKGVILVVHSLPKDDAGKDPSENFKFQRTEILTPTP